MKVADYISKEEAAVVTQAVHEVEKKTSGEIVPIVINRSDTYSGATWRIAVLVMLLLAALEAWLFPGITLMTLLYLQLPGLMVGLMLGSMPRLERFAIHPREMEEEVKQRAIQAFFNQNLHTTRDRTGVLIFVSLMEHRVEILADTGINEKIDPKVWQTIVDQLIEKVRNKQLGPGLQQAVEACGEILHKYFPIREDDKNELHNDLVLIDM